jgi:hypothetical protein
VPTEADVRRYLRQYSQAVSANRNRPCFEITPGPEKVARGTSCPKVFVTKEFSRHVPMWVTVIRRAILGKKQGGGTGEDTLLVDTRDGRVMDESSVRRTVKTIVSTMSHLPVEKRDVNMQLIRRTFATLAFQHFKAGKTSFTTEEAFLEHLRSVMNTSINELTRTYIAVLSENFRGPAEEIAGMLASPDDVVEESHSTLRV